jgi:hypothetical protein
MRKPKYTPEERKARKKESDRLYRERNKDKLREKSRKYYHDNRDKCLEYNKKWVAENKEKRNEYENQYRLTHRQSERERWRLWYSDENNAQKRIEYNKKYRKENKDKIKEYQSNNREAINAIKLRSQKKHPETHRDTEHKRRARKNSCHCESINNIEIYERDKWVCKICNNPVDKDLKWPDMMSPSLDHIIPLSKGGNHVATNVQLAHLRCNIKAGNKLKK